jgi:hypothetical protein
MSDTEYEYTSLDPSDPDYRTNRARLENGAGWEVAPETPTWDDHHDNDNAIYLRRPARIGEIERLFASSNKRLLIPRENGSWAASIRPAAGAPPDRSGPPTVGGLATPLAAAEAALRHYGPPHRLDCGASRARPGDYQSDPASTKRRHVA